MLDPLPYATYMFVMSITPGPNNLMLTASGAAFGIRATVPQLMGIVAGGVVQVVAVVAGLGALFAAWPLLHTVLQWAGAAYLLWLGWKLLGSGEVGERQAHQPITFIQAVGFQFLNPKSWVMSLSSMALFVPEGTSFLMACAFLVPLRILINLPCIGVWALFGSSLRGVLQRRTARLAFNGIMAVALAATGVIMVT